MMGGMGMLKPEFIEDAVIASEEEYNLEKIEETFLQELTFLDNFCQYSNNY